MLKQPYSEARLYLKHNDTDLLDTLNDGLWGPCNGDGTLCWVGQHVPCYLYLSSCWLQRYNKRELYTGYQKYGIFPNDGMLPTSLISLILQPPLPMSEPHWLAGTTRRMVTGGLLVAVLLVIEVLMSWTENGEKKTHKWQLYLYCFYNSTTGNLTSSSFSMIMEKALKMEVVGPARVMILSGQFPSEMLMRAPLCRHRKQEIPN